MYGFPGADYDSWKTTPPVESEPEDLQGPSKPRYVDCATNYALWVEYVDPCGVIPEHEFFLLGVDEKMALQVEAFGTEE